MHISSSLQWFYDIDVTMINNGGVSAKVVVVVYFILSRLSYLAFSANLGLQCMPHPGMGLLV